MLDFINKNLNFIGLNFGEIINSLIIIFIIFIISTLTFFLFKSKSKTRQNYHLNDYWENRYNKYTKEMDWYINYQKICEDFHLQTLFKAHLINNKKSKFLELGCGNSSLASDLYDDGYKNIQALDYSLTVVENMKQKFKNKKIKCKIIIKIFFSYQRRLF